MMKPPVGGWASMLHKMMQQPTNAHRVIKENAIFLLRLISSQTTSEPFQHHHHANISEGTYH